MSFLEWIVKQYSLSHYTPFTTAVNILVALICLIPVVSFFKKYRVFSYIYTKPHEVVFSLLGWVLLGVSIRVIKDLRLVKGTISLLLVTPFIYIEILLISSLIFVLSKHLSQYIWVYGGYALSFPFLLFDMMHIYTFRWEAAVFVLTLTLLSALIGILLFSSTLSIYAFIFQMLDGYSTFISLTFYGFGEEHILPNFLINLVESQGWTLFGSGAWIFPLIKFILVVGLLKILDKAYREESVENIIIKIFMIVLGMGVGIRNTFNLLFI